MGRSPYAGNPLVDLIDTRGEERLSRRVVDQEPSGRATLQWRHHSDTRTFRALSITVNDELDMLDSLLEVASDWQVPGGMLCVISLHSLKGCPVKTALVRDERLQRITRLPETAAAEQCSNPHSRSAKWR